MKEFLGGIQNCVTVVDIWIFDRNITFALPLNCGDLDYWYTDHYGSKGVSGYKLSSKYIRFFPTKKNKSLSRKKAIKIIFDVKMFNLK